jgi:DNA polymerase I-like protein with 3'-5' exonuclease and polymerase domains
MASAPTRQSYQSNSTDNPEKPEAREDVNKAARDYGEEGLAVLPTPVGEKEAKITGWPSLVLGPEAIDEYFPPGKQLNIVRVNGTNSSGRGDLDLDRPEALKVANYLIPDGILRFGREGGTLGHIEVRFADTVPRTIQYELSGEGDDQMVVELRADGSQTLLPPSVYPNGDRCVWQEGEVLEAHAVTLRGYAEDIAVSALLLMNYPGEGARHQFWLGAIGMLIKARHPVERVRRIVEATARCANDREWRNRLKIIDTTTTKFMLGERIAGRQKLAKVAPDVPQILKHWLGIGKITDSGLPHIVTNDRPLREVSDEATDALLAANEPPEIFGRSGNLARLAQDAEGRPVIQDVDKDRLRHRMTRTAEFLKVGEDMQHVYPPDAVVADVLAAKGFYFPELVGITQSPALRPSGTVLDRTGYDTETGLIYVPEEKVDVEVPFEPTEEDVEHSVALLKELYIDFPFVDESSFANMLALTMTPILRPAYTGPTPLAVIDKPSPGTGASLLSEVVCAIATAQPAAMMSPPDNDEETRKQVTAVLRTGRPIIVIDNLGSELKNASWSRVLTSTTWEDRILGHSRVATLPQRSTWITSGNNVRLGGDVPRRCYWIRMDAKLEKPWDRKPEQFIHPNLLDWVSEVRGDLLGAILTLARNWYSIGKPQWSGRPPGSFEGWARTVGGILQAAGVPGFLGNADEMFDKVVAGVGEWESFLVAWRENFGENDITTKWLVEHLEDEDAGDDLRDVLPAELAFLLADGGALVTRKFGEAFAKKENVRHGDCGLYIYRGGTYKNSVTWAVAADTPSGGPKGDGTQSSGESVSQVTHRPVGPGKVGKKQQDVIPKYQEGAKSELPLESQPSESPDSPDSPEQGIEQAQGDARMSQDTDEGGSDNVVDLRSHSSEFYTYVADESLLSRCVDDIREAGDDVGLDLETTSLNWWEGEIRIIAVTTVSGSTWLVDAFKVSPEALESLYRVLEEKHVIIHNAAFDAPYLLRAGCNLKRVGCTKVLSRLRFAGADNIQHSLVDVVKRHATSAAVAKIKAGEVDHLIWSQPTIGRAGLEYAANDSRYLIGIYRDEVRTIEREKMGEVAGLEERFLNVVAEASATGMPVNPERWGAVIEEAIERKRVLAEQLDGLLDEDVDVPEEFANRNAGRDDVGKINWASTEQKVWAVESLSLAVPTKWDHKKKAEKKTLDKDHLHLIDHPIAEALREYQAIANFPTTFANAIEERFADGWVFPDWQQLQARTGRMSCCSPTMHNMPRKSKLREAIVAPDGYRLIALDFSQIEPRVLAAISRDRALLKAFRGKKDIYRFVASKVTSTPMEAVSKTTRDVFKTIVLGLIYGMGEYGLTLRIHRDIDPDIPAERIVAYRDGFFAAFPEASEWRENLEAEFRNGSTETRTILGRRRMNVETPRQRWNAPIQGAACDAFKLAAAMLHERMDEVGAFKIIALIHDEVVLLVPEARVDVVEEWACKTMAEAAAEPTHTDRGR